MLVEYTSRDDSGWFRDNSVLGLGTEHVIGIENQGLRESLRQPLLVGEG